MCKSALRHSYTLDTRDNKQLASSGYFLKSVTEMGGMLGRGADFARNETHGQLHAPAPGGCTFSLCGSFGLLRALRGDVSRYFDRFFLGGPLSLRGFRSRGVGPVVGAMDEVRSAAGGEAMMAVTASLSRPLPVPPDLRRLVDARFQVFTTLGNNMSLSGGKSVASSILPLVSGTRLAVGMGLVFPTALGRLEVSLSKPLIYTKEDRTATWGVGLIPE
jgi:outer membrane protein insertion porin family